MGEKSCNYGPEEICDGCAEKSKWVVLNIEGKPWPKYPIECEECCHGPFVRDNFKPHKDSE